MGKFLRIFLIISVLMLCSVIFYLKNPFGTEFSKQISTLEETIKNYAKTQGINLASLKIVKKDEVSTHYQVGETNKFIAVLTPSVEAASELIQIEKQSLLQAAQGSSVKIQTRKIVYGENSDGYIQGNAVYTSTQTANIGYSYQGGVARYFVFFDTSFLGEESQIEGADLFLMPQQITAACNFNLVIRSGQPVYPHKPLQASDFNVQNYGAVAGSSVKWPINFNYNCYLGEQSRNALMMYERYHKITLNSAGLASIDKKGVTKFIVMNLSDSSVSADNFGVFYTQEAGLDKAPRLIINYTGPNSPPTISSLSASTNPIKAGRVQTITAVGANDPNSDSLSFYCCQDNSNSCLPSQTNNQCSNNISWLAKALKPDPNYYSYINSQQSSVSSYDKISCFLPVPSSPGTSYARCRLYDGSDYSPTIASVSFNIVNKLPIPASEGPLWINQYGEPPPADTRLDGLYYKFNPKKIAVGNDGDTYVMGEYQEPRFGYAYGGTWYPVPTYEYGIFIAGYNGANGQQKWLKKVLNFDYVYSDIRVGSDNNIYVLIGRPPCTLIKYRPDGTQIGQVTLGSYSPGMSAFGTYCNKMDFDSQGNIYIAGRAWQSLGVSGFGYNDVLMKINYASLNKIWDIVHSRDGLAAFSDLVIDNDNNVYARGSKYGGQNFGCPPQGCNCIPGGMCFGVLVSTWTSEYLVEYDSAGNLLDERTETITTPYYPPGPLIYRDDGRIPSFESLWSQLRKDYSKDPAIDNYKIKYTVGGSPFYVLGYTKMGEGINCLVATEMPGMAFAVAHSSSNEIYVAGSCSLGDVCVVKYSSVFSPPDVETLYLQGPDIEKTQAVLKGTLRDLGRAPEADVWFGWGSQSSNTETIHQTLTSLGPFEFTVGGLLPQNSYRYKAFASSTVAASYGSELGFTTPSSPIDFDFSINPSSGQVLLGSSTSATLKVRITSGDIDYVDFSLSDMPNGISTSFSKTSCSAFPCDSTITFSPSLSVPIGVFQLKIKATATQ